MTSREKPVPRGPLAGLKVIEMPSIGPVPFCGMLMADLGAEVLQIERGGSNEPPKRAAKFNLMARGKHSVAFDLKDEESRSRLVSAIGKCDVLLEGFRPGTMERLGFTADALFETNPGLVYGRMTGWGQDGPLAQAAGHDINYIALTGALHAIGRRGAPPTPPLNLVGDFGGGSLYLLIGVLAALHERRSSGRGQVIDAAMVDGAASMMTVFYGLLAAGSWRDECGSNTLDTGAPFYDVFPCADDKFIAIGALEPKFFAELVRRMGIDPGVGDHQDRESWPVLRKAFSEAFLQKPRDEWTRLLEGTDACFAPVLSLAEAPHHHHLSTRGTFEEHFGVVQPGVAPRFSRTPGAVCGPPPEPGSGGEALLSAWGVSA